MTARRDPSPHHPSTVSNSLEILETVAALGLGVTAKEIATSLHMPPATAYRLLNALVAEEYLVRTADLRGFGLGARLNGLLTTASTPNLCHAARVHLAAVRDEVRFAIHLLVFHPTSVRVLDADPDHPVRAERELVRNLHASAAGHLLLASASTWQRLLPPTALRKLTHTPSPASPNSTRLYGPYGPRNSLCKATSSKLASLVPLYHSSIPRVMPLELSVSPGHRLEPTLC